MSECIHITANDIRNFHRYALKMYGGIEGETSPGLIEYVAEVPYYPVYGVDRYPTIFDKAAYYLKAFTDNQYFSDGNKRTGVLCALTLLDVNGFELMLDPMELYEYTMLTANKKITSINDIANFLKVNVKQIF
ncbi:type II toxin-antitoxin system death-on-curing family toxin [Sporolactobacillus sp. THM19-2]|uniref:type II toxin-antitoxin system death-on-curing family toxin n=1 Tax=Sporolactobacillus sp. THM19-2 TaxID=2511171 RepID=UPI00101F0538|nr:type II toxin-antitoxin system death-on-curing family toxin [Sporolactobacillus sp. THM19-2]RYL92401.1 type II toxin-antitoxin system death-on-curing family toxin [Sporolactobacillus sp. THM19-2]